MLGWALYSLPPCWPRWLGETFTPPFDPLNWAPQLLFSCLPKTKAPHRSLLCWAKVSSFVISTGLLGCIISFPVSRECSNPGRALFSHIPHLEIWSVTAADVSVSGQSNTFRKLDSYSCILGEIQKNGYGLLSSDVSWVTDIIWGRKFCEEKRLVEGGTLLEQLSVI